MVGDYISGGLKVGAAVTNLIAGARAARKQKNIYKDELKNNQMWYDKNYNEDATERADAVAALEKQKQAMRERQQNAQGANAVMGASAESDAREKAAQTNALANTVSNINLAGENRKDNVERSYINSRNAIQDKLSALEAQKANNIANAASQLANGAGSVLTMSAAKDDGTTDKNKNNV